MVSFYGACRWIVIYMLHYFVTKDGFMCIDENHNMHRIGGANDPFYVLKIKNETVWWDILSKGEVGFGEAYAEGKWVLKRGDLGLFFISLAKNKMDTSIFDKIKWLSPMTWIGWSNFSNLYYKLSANTAKKSIETAYDIGDDFYASFLDKNMVYTSGKWDNDNDTLFTAQTNKMDLLVRKSKILDMHEPHVMDIGSGWGSLLGYMKKIKPDMYGVGISNSPNMIHKSQATYPDIKFIETDYRNYHTTERFDAILSVEMIESIGVDQFPKFALMCHQYCKVGGKVIIQVITAPGFLNPTARTKHKSVADTFVTKHIFPGGQIPHVEFIHEAMNPFFKLTHTESFGYDYAKTLLQWRKNLLRNQNGAYPQNTIRAYEYYLAWCQAGFSSELLNVHQLVFTKNYEY